MLLERDKTGLLVKRMGEVVDGEFQKYTVAGGAYFREHFFGKYPELLKLVEHMTDEQLEQLKRGGHDPEKVYAAFKAAVEHQGPADGDPGPHRQGLRPGRGGRGQERRPPDQEDRRQAAHRVPQPLRPGRARRGRDARPPSTSRPTNPRRFSTSKSIARRWAALCRSARCSARRCRRPARTSSRPTRRAAATRSRPRPACSWTCWPACLRDPNLGKYVVPIVPDEARTFGMDPFFSKYKIYSNVGQLYEPVDAEFQQAAYREAKDGQLLEEGITEAGSMSFVHRGRHGLRHARRADDPVLHLLFDVRLPADRRPDLGGGRPADARLPAGGDGRPHHAQRRGAAARGRPQPPGGRDGADGRGLRPGDGVRAGRHRPRRHPPHVPGARRRTSSTTSLSTTTITRCCRCRKARPRASSKGLYKLRPAANAQAEGAEACICSAAGRSCRTRCGRRSCWPSISAWRPTSGARPATRSCAATRWRCERWNLLHPTEKPRQNYLQTRAGEGGRPVRGGQRLHAGGAGDDRPLGARRPVRAGHGRLRPQRDAGGAAAPLRGGRRVHRRGGAVPAGPRGAVKPDVVQKAIQKFEINPEKISPMRA